MREKNTYTVKNLTSREMDVASRIGTMTVPEIAEELDLEPRTVKDYLGYAMRKTNTHNVVSLAVLHRASLSR